MDTNFRKQDQGSIYAPGACWYDNLVALNTTKCHPGPNFFKVETSVHKLGLTYKISDLWLVCHDF